MEYDICPWCGAADRNHCDLEDEAGFCPWEENEDSVHPEDAWLSAYQDDELLDL